jgi:hypothetical protein
MLKRIITLTLIAVMIFSSTFIFAATTQSQTDWKSSFQNLKDMGIASDSDVKTTGNMSRAVFSKLIINATGNSDMAKSLSGSTTFSDVSANSAYSGYINAAVQKGFMSAMADGKFKPNNALTYAQLCTAVIRALGYAGSDIIGGWPAGYMEKASSLGITAGFKLKSGDSVPISTAIIIIDRMLDTDIKKANPADTEKTLKDSVGLGDDQDSLVYGEPQVAFNFNPNSKKLGSITFDTGMPILRNTVNNSVSPATSVVGETISRDDIKDKDVVYEVYNKLNILIYYLVVDNKVDGQITSILPSKYSPKTVQINNVNYELGEYADLNKFNSSQGSYKVGDTVSVVLGYDGKVVDAYYSEDSDNKDYAFVVNSSTMVSKEAADYGKTYFTVDLMHVDGTTKTYKIMEDPNQYKWKIIKYSLITDDTVALLNVGYMTPADVTIDKYEKRINQGYAADNIKIFNCTDSTVKLININDIPNGTLAAGKVQFMGTSGDFNDVNIMLIRDAFDEQYKNFLVQKIQVPDGKRVTTYTYSLVLGANQYTYTSKNEIPGAVVGSVFKMRMYNNNISSFEQIKDPDALSWYVQAIDSKRIKMNEWVYRFSPDVNVYFTDYAGNLTIKKITDIATGTGASYGTVKLYCDRPLNNGGKVQAIVVSMK